MQPDSLPLEALTRRLAECPADFLAEPAIGKLGTVNVAAVMADLLRDLGSETVDLEALRPFTNQAAKAQRNQLRIILVACWLLHDPWFCNQGRFAKAALRLLTNGLAEYAGYVSPEQAVNDPDRREELTRLCLRDLNLLPAGESQAQAKDRLETLDTAERQRVIKAARKAEARAQDIRRKMAEEEAKRAESKSFPE